MAVVAFVACRVYGIESGVDGGIGKPAVWVVERRSRGVELAGRLHEIAAEIRVRLWELVRHGFWEREEFSRLPLIVAVQGGGGVRYNAAEQKRKD